MSVIVVVLILVAIGFALYVINRAVPMEANMKMILNGVVAVCTILWLLDVFGVLHSGINWGCNSDGIR